MPFHLFIVISSDELTKSPFDKTSIARMMPVCRVKVARVVPTIGSDTVIVVSNEPTAILPFFRRIMYDIKFPYEESFVSSRPVLKFHTLTVLSSEPDANMLLEINLSARMGLEGNKFLVTIVSL